jgi:hypothetical protein
VPAADVLVERGTPGGHPGERGGRQGDADQQGRGGGGGAPRIARRVLGRQPPGGAEQPDGQPDQAGDEHRPEQEHAGEQRPAAGEHQRHAVLHHRRREQGEPGGRRQHGERRPRPADARARTGRDVRAQRRQRAHPQHPPRRRPGGGHGDHQADGDPAQQPRRRRRGGDDRGVRRDQVDRGDQPVPEGGTGDRPGEGRERPDGGRLQAYRTRHLPPGGADTAQQREVPQALREQDGERVRDHHRRDEDRDPGEQQQHHPHAVHLVLHGGQPLLRERLRRLRLPARRERARLAAHRHRAQVEAVAPAQQLRPGDVHVRLRGRRRRLHQADHAHRGRGGALADHQPVADRDVVGEGEVHVRHRLAAAHREAPRFERLPAPPLDRGDRPHARLGDPPPARAQRKRGPADRGRVLAEPFGERDHILRFHVRRRPPHRRDHQVRVPVRRAETLDERGAGPGREHADHDDERDRGGDRDHRRDVPAQVGAERREEDGAHQTIRPSRMVTTWSA